MHYKEKMIIAFKVCFVFVPAHVSLAGLPPWQEDYSL